LGITIMNGNVVVSWPAANSGFSLYSTPTLPATNWTFVSGGTNIAGQSSVVTLPISPTQKYFRLQK